MSTSAVDPVNVQKIQSSDAQGSLQQMLARGKPPPPSVSHFSRRSPCPVDWKALAPEPLPGTPTVAAQSTLPRLPVPDLTSTLARLKGSLRPIAWSDAEYADVLCKIDAFAERKAPELQERLLRRAVERQHWLEEWWDDDEYLAYRKSVGVVHC